MKRGEPGFWKYYNAKKVQEGSLTLFIDPEIAKQWVVHNRPGRPSYNLAVIQLALILRERFRICLRSTQGLLASLLQLLGMSNQAPHYTLYCKRAWEISKQLQRYAKQPAVVAADSTGIKVYGEGEWRKSRIGYGRHQKWIKFHITMDLEARQVIAHQVTDDNTIDASVIPRLFDQIHEPIKIFIGDGAYDRAVSRLHLHQRGIRAIIPPRCDAVLNSAPYMSDRNEAVHLMLLANDPKDGRKEWKKSSGYHRRSLIESAFSSMKRRFGDRVTTRKSENQAMQLQIRCHILNRFAALTG